MRLGLIGLGRIGAFHAETLSELDGVDSLVVTDAVPAVTARSPSGSVPRPRTSPEALISGRRGRDRDRRRHQRAHRADHGPASTPASRCSARSRCPAASPRPSRSPATSTSSGVPVQIGYPRRFDPAYLAARDAVADGELGWVHTVRSTTLDPAPPPRGYIAVSGGIFRDCASTTSTRCAGSPAARSSRSTPPAAPAATTSSPSSATSPPRRPCSPSTTAPPRWCPTPATTRAGTTSASSCTAPSTASPPGWTDSTPLRNLEPGTAWPAGKPGTFFMDRLADAFRAELTAFTEVVAGQRPSPCTVDDALAVTWIAEAATLSLQQHRPVRIAEVQLTH